ncbi:glycosyltransferase family 4 protein [Erythrobacter sp.]|uniref:glycosyltransferase n=1 Tax=Erythrobacter sp. TaxID=1042 RepID=UPI0025E4753B|nr:glycosyltransferase family 4 protein [Erythrobacter sp.]
MKQVLIVSRQRLIGATNGSSAYLIGLAQTIRDAGMEPHLLQPSPAIMGRIPFFRTREDIDVFASHKVRGVTRIGRWFVSRDPAVWRDAAIGAARGLARRIGFTGGWTRDRPRPYAIAEEWSEADREWLRTEASPRDWEVVIADYAFQAEAFGVLGTPRTRSAIIMHDLFHARPASGEGGDKDSVALLTRDAELAMLARAGTVIAIQQEEAAFLHDALPASRIVIAPAAHEPDPPPAPGDPFRLLFVGSRTAPNTHGLGWFLEQCWPMLMAASPGTRLDVAGTVCTDFAGSAPEGVRLLGLVPDLDPCYAEAGIVISPLRFGSGLKIKLVEALAKGRPVVATPVTLQGVAETCGRAVIEAGSAEGFAAGIVALQRSEDLRTRLSAEALRAVTQHFAPRSAHRAFREWLQDAAKGSAGPGRLLPPDASAPISCFQ